MANGKQVPIPQPANDVPEGAEMRDGKPIPITIGVRKNQDKADSIIIDFGKDVRVIEFTPEQAADLGNFLIAKARKAMGR